MQANGSHSPPANLAELGLRPLVALAVRWVMRVRPLIVFPDDPRLRAADLSNCVDEEIRSATDFAAGRLADFKDEDTSVFGNASSIVSTTAGSRALAAVGGLASLLRFCVKATETNVRDIVRQIAGSAAGQAQEVFREAEKAAQSADASEGQRVFRDAANRDCENLARLIGHVTTDLVSVCGSAIDPRTDGPLGTLWPSGQPTWFEAR